ncbi:transposase [Streptomyces sp. NPDC007157]|uniref:transposase n=1 Tax=Streptomyces sp. NPDC007157 TaxID=3154681 RepID=UPI0034002C19
MRADLVPGDLWERVAPLLPPTPERRHHPGRLRVPDRAALAGVMYVSRTGAAWRDVPAETVGCSGVTAWRRLRDWTEAGVWPRPHAALLTGLRRADLLGLQGRPRRKSRRLYADRGYDFNKYRRLLWKRGIKPMIARRGVAHGFGLGKVRWVVERAFAWLHRFKRLRIRYERRADLHQGLLELACSLICLRRLRSSF